MLTTGFPNLSYTDGSVQENTSYQYEVVAINGAAMRSEPAQIAVKTPPDDIPPTVVSAEPLDQDTIRIVFSEPVTPMSAGNPANYRLSNWLSVLSATLQPDGQTVELSTSLMSGGSTYTLTVSNVSDVSSLGNAIAPGTSVEFSTNFSVEVTDVSLSTGSSFIVQEFAAGGYVYSDQLQYHIGSTIPDQLSDAAIQIRLPNGPRCRSRQQCL